MYLNEWIAKMKVEVIGLDGNLEWLYLGHKLINCELN